MILSKLNWEKRTPEERKLLLAIRDCNKAGGGYPLIDVMKTLFDGLFDNWLANWTDQGQQVWLTKDAMNILDGLGADAGDNDFYRRKLAADQRHTEKRP